MEAKVADVNVAARRIISNKDNASHLEMGKKGQKQARERLEVLNNTALLQT